MGAAVGTTRGTVQTDDLDARPGRHWSSRRAGVLVFVVLMAIYVISPTNQNAGDTYLAGPTAASIVTSGDLDLDEFTSPEVLDDSAYVEHDGHRYDYFPWPRSLFAVPVAALFTVGDAVGLTPGPVELADGHSQAWVLSMPPAAIATAAAAAIAAMTAWYLARGRRRDVALIAGLGVGLSTGYWSISSRGLWQHGPGVLLLSLALYGVVRLAQDPQEQGDWQSRRSALLAGFGVAAATAMRPTFVVFAVAIALWLAWARPRTLSWAATGALLGVGPYVVLNLLVFGTLVPPYVDTKRFEWHSDYAEALVANLISPGRGALVFMPALVLGAIAGVLLWWRRRDDPMLRRLVVLLAVAVAVLYALVAAFPHWWAGFSYGPRLLLDAVPVLVIFAVPVIERVLMSPPRRLVTMLVLVVAGWSIVVNAEGAVIRSAGCWNAQPVSIDDDTSRIWSLRDPLFTAGIRDFVADPGGSLARSCLDETSSDRRVIPE